MVPQVIASGVTHAPITPEATAYDEWVSAPNLKQPS